MKKDIDLNLIIEERLKLQSTQRYFEANEIKPTIRFLASKRFREKYNSWPQYKKKIFLQYVAGIHWKKMRERIEK